MVYRPFRGHTLDTVCRVLACTLLASWGCGETDPPVVDDGPIKVGILGPAAGAEPAFSGARLAVRQVNELGGVLGRNVEIVIRDTQARRGPAREGYRQLVEDEGVVAVAGPAFGIEGLAVVDLATEFEVPAITILGAVPVVWEAQQDVADPYAFSAVGPDAWLFRPAVVEMAKPEIGCTRIAWFDINELDDETKAIHLTEVQGGADDAGIELVNTTYLPADVATYRGMLDEAFAATPDCVLSNLDGDNFGTFLRDWREDGGPEVKYLQTGPLGLITANAAVDVTLLEGLINMDYLILDPLSPERRDFESAFNANFPTIDEPFSHLYYDAMMVILLAIEKAQTTNGTVIRDEILNVSRSDGLGADIEQYYGPATIADAFAWLRARGTDLDYAGATGGMDFRNCYGYADREIEVLRVTNTDPFETERVSLLDAPARDCE
jgi:ABC-type branched-subunit amino acid transport system substrate-binding protein